MKVDLTEWRHLSGLEEANPYDDERMRRLRALDPADRGAQSAAVRQDVRRGKAPRIPRVGSVRLPKIPSLREASRHIPAPINKYLQSLAGPWYREALREMEEDFYGTVFHLGPDKMAVEYAKKYRHRLWSYESFRKDFMSNPRVGYRSFLADKAEESLKTLTHPSILGWGRDDDDEGALSWAELMRERGEPTPRDWNINGSFVAEAAIYAAMLQDPAASPSKDRAYREALFPRVWWFLQKAMEV